jgi:hypothetical protein
METRMTRGVWRRLARAVSGCVLAGALSVPLGPTTTGRAVDQINAGSMRGVPVPPIPAAPRPTSVWVPGSYVSVPTEREPVFVPGHWREVTPEGQVIVPPLQGTVPSTGASAPLQGQAP